MDSLLKRRCAINLAIEITLVPVVHLLIGLLAPRLYKYQHTRSDQTVITTGMSASKLTTDRQRSVVSFEADMPVVITV